MSPLAFRTDHCFQYISNPSIRAVPKFMQLGSVRSRVGKHWHPSTTGTIHIRYFFSYTPLAETSPNKSASHRRPPPERPPPCTGKKLLCSKGSTFGQVHSSVGCSWSLPGTFLNQPQQQEITPKTANFADKHQSCGLKYVQFAYLDRPVIHQYAGKSSTSVFPSPRPDTLSVNHSNAIYCSKYCMPKTPQKSRVFRGKAHFSTLQDIDPTPSIN